MADALGALIEQGNGMVRQFKGCRFAWANGDPKRRAKYADETTQKWANISQERVTDMVTDLLEAGHVTGELSVYEVAYTVQAEWLAYQAALFLLTKDENLRKAQERFDKKEGRLSAFKKRFESEVTDQDRLEK